MSQLRCLLAGFIILSVGTICALYPILTYQKPLLDSRTDFYSPRDPTIATDCTKNYCSWEYQNKERPDRQVLAIENNQLISAEEKDTYLIECIPNKFGYSSTDAARIFPEKKFTSWNTDVKSRIEFTDDKFTLNCPGDFQGQYVLGESTYLERQGRLPFNPDMQPYTGAVNVPNDVEFVYATCQREVGTSVEHAAYRPRVKPDVYERVERDMADYGQKYGTKPRPMTVIHVMVDSLSRNHFYRNFPKTVEYLNTLENPPFSLFDFKINNVMGNNSPPNVIPWLTGKIGFQERQNAKEDFLGPDSLYSKIRDMGFVTMIGTEFCHRYFSWYMGEEINVDHIMSSFWCAAKKYSGFWDISKERRCIGQQDSHKYLLDYALEFTELYKPLNKWILIDSLSAHEDSGTVIRTMDNDMLNFMKAFVENNAGSDFVLFLESDHGMRYGDWFRLVDGSMEHKLPVLLQMYSNTILERLPYAANNLYYNSNRLVSKFDHHILDRYLSYLPYTSENIPNLVEETMSSGHAVNVVWDKIPNTRTCDDINIPGYHCSCLELVEIDASSVETLALEAIWEINRELRTHRFSYGKVWKPISLKEINHAEQQFINEFESNYKIQLTINEASFAQFEVVARVASARIGFRDPDKGYSTSIIHFQGKKHYLMVKHIRRLDTYAGVCQEVAIAYGVTAEICIWESLQKVFSVAPGNLNEVLRRNNFRAIGKPNANCFDTWREAGGFCTDDLSFQLYNSWDGCARCQETDHPAAPYVIDDTCHISNGKPDRRCEKTGEFSRICTCKKGS